MEVLIKIFKKDNPIKELSRIVPALPVVENNHKTVRVSCDYVGKMISTMLKEVNSSETQNVMFTGIILITPDKETLGSRIELLFQEE